MLYSQSDYQSLSTEPGIYLFLDEKDSILYVGKAKNLRKRVGTYFAKYIELGPKTQALISKVKQIKAVIVPSEIEALLLEIKYIKKYKPKYNIRFIDGKNYPLIRITTKDDYPKVLIARRPEDKRSKYFGPFPNANAMRLVLRTIRKIFPYQSVPNHAKKICLYYHLGLCPCPPVFSSKRRLASAWDSDEFKKDYGTTIRHITDFLNGSTRKIIRDLTNERDCLSKNENFEKANLVQNKINAINLITGPFYKTEFSSKRRPASGWDYEVNPNFKEDLRKKEISDLKEILNKNNVKVSTLERIECYDVSNISGTNATGSLVVFTNGEKEGSLYRKFKIRTIGTPNDFAMIAEVLQRRMKHKEWRYPDLIIVDGGKGQVSAALKAMRQFNNLAIPVIALAKREEIVITSDFREISLPKDSEALKLIMRIRDEAHRFAITYHKKLRSKTFLN